MIGQQLEVGATVHNFKVNQIKPIPELRSEAALFTHKKNKARLLHLFNNDANNLFCIGFRTPVYDNTGVPHILEHSVLAGSKKFPLKDPFKEMLKGSLQTFLNAITYPDKTIYPVASQVEKDYFNLVDVYCDAVFNPLLSEMTFAQEGWHFELEKPDGPVSLKGIVYNEMKGVFSDFRSHVSRKTLSELLPDTTYFYESGGEPEHISDLTWEQFKAFHDKYYHPSNAFIILYGNIPSEKTLAFLDKNYLTHYDYGVVDSEITPQQTWDKPRSVTLTAPSSKEDDGTASVILSWLLESSTDPIDGLCGRIFSHYFFNNESSPLRRALIDSKLGEDLDDMCGFEGDLVQGLFCAGLRKSDPKDAEAIQTLILDTIKKEVEKGLDPELLEGSIRQIEFTLREITDGSHFPYSLKLSDRVFRSWIYGGDPLAHLCFEEPLSFLKEKKREGTAYFTEKIKKLFLENTHVLLATVKASAELGESLGKESEEQAQRLSKNFSEKERADYYNLTKKLLKEQTAKPSKEALATLPKIDKKDLPLKSRTIPIEIKSIEATPFYMHDIFTAGIVYLDIGFDCLGISAELLPYLPLYAELITRCGAAGKSSEAMAKRISLTTGGIGTSDICATRFGTKDDLVFKGFFHGKSLPERFGEMVDIFIDLFTKPELDNTKLIQDILLEMRNDLNGSVLRSGHHFAIAHASARLSPSKYVEEVVDGLSQLRFLNAIIQKGDYTTIVEAIHKLHALVVSKNRCLFSMTCENPSHYKNELARILAHTPEGIDSSDPVVVTLSESLEPVGIEINSSVNYVAQTWLVDQVTPDTMGELLLLSRDLSTGYLWDKVRVEGGAYGGMASISQIHPVISCASYRDPNVTSTLDTFIKGLEHSKKGLTPEEVEQSIIGTIGRIDQPHSPHSYGFGETLARLCGRTPEIRQQIREAVLSCTAEKLANRAEALLKESNNTISVFGSSDAFDTAEKDGRSFKREPLLPT